MKTRISCAKPVLFRRWVAALVATCLPLPAFAATVTATAGRQATVKTSAPDGLLRVTVTPPVVAPDAAFSGRIVVMMTPGENNNEPRFGPNWFRPGPMLALDVKNGRPGAPIVVGGPGTIVFPRPPGPWAAPGVYTVQAILDKNQGERDFASAPGNGYSAPMRVTVGANGALLLPGSISGPLTINRVVPAHRFNETTRAKEIVLESRLLTRFYNKPTRMRAAVLLPEGYAAEADSNRRWPVVYEIPGFGGRHYGAEREAERPLLPGEIPMIHVVLDPEAATGHHVFADSANNGPRGQALVTELIPFIERTYRGMNEASARFVTGHSSGGWSSLWLQVTYPDTFGGVWSTSPDPVDFRDFQRINLYAPNENLFTDPLGNPRPLARLGEQPVIFYQTFSDMEAVMGHGGQIASFEAVFSPRLPDGSPRPLWNRASGAIDPATARAWEKYDIRLILERNWKTLGPKLKNKLHVYTGARDTFYLEGAVEKLKAALAALPGSDAVIEIVPGKDHGNLRDRAMQERIGREMADTFRRNNAVGAAATK